MECNYDNGYIYSDDQDTKVSFYRKGMMHKKGKIQKIAKQNDSLGLERTSAWMRSNGWSVKLKSKKDGFKVSALTSPPTRLEPFSDAA